MSRKQHLYNSFPKGGAFHLSTACYLRTSQVYDGEFLILSEAPLLLSTKEAAQNSLFWNQCFQHHLCQAFCSTLSLFNVAVSGQIHFTNTAIFQMVNLPKIDLTNIFCSHIFNLCHVVFIVSLFPRERNAAGSKNMLSLKVFFFPY